MIYEIRSKYILNYIFNYIKDDNLDLKLLAYSKYFKNKLDINLSYCYKKYLDSLCFDINEYLYKKEEEYEKDILIKKYNNFISKNKLNKEEFEMILYEILNNQNEKNIKFITIDSPLFEIISKTKKFGKNYEIYISQKDIDKFNLKDNYRILLNKINNNPYIKYYKIYYIYSDKTKIDYLKELNVNYNNIKKISLIYNDDNIIVKEDSNK